MSTVEKVAITPATMDAASKAFHYSPGVHVLGSGLLCMAGQVGRDESGKPIEDVTEQFVAAFKAVQSILVEAGASFEDVVDLITYHTSFDTFAAFTEVKDRYVQGPVFPAWTAVGVAGLAIPGLLVEVKATAVVP